MKIANEKDTIAAIATAKGQGGIGVIRISGSLVLTIAEQLLGFTPKPRYAHTSQFKDSLGQAIDHGIVLYFKAPHSFTGEDILELQGHGGLYLQQLLLERIQQLGARLAEPGEFSLRAFLNGKLDLAQAEAIADLINASSAQSVKAAMNALQGKFSQIVDELVRQIIYIRMYVEAAIDFPEEEIDFLKDQHIVDQLKALQNKFAEVFQQAKQGVLLQQGMTVVIAGIPNVGKSSLMNRLAGDELAIVTHRPGTTRDILREQIQIDGMPLHIIDTAGIRESDDPIEQEGIRRAMKAIEKADHLLFLTDDFDAPLESLIQNANLALVQNFVAHKNITFIRNKIDIFQRKPLLFQANSIYEIHLSAQTGIGCDLLRQHLKTLMGYQEPNESCFTARQRHLDALKKAYQHVCQAFETLISIKAGELMAEDLKLAQEQLNSITGEFTSDDLLGKIFSTFCIGK